MPTVGTHLPDDWEFTSKFKTVVDNHYRGKPGWYLRELIEKDLNGLSVGMPESAYTIEQLDEFRRIQSAMLRAERMAREYLYVEPSQRAEVGLKLCWHIMNATRIGGGKDEEPPKSQPMAAEDKAPKPGEQPTQEELREMGEKAKKNLAEYPHPKKRGHA